MSLIVRAKLIANCPSLNRSCQLSWRDILISATRAFPGAELACVGHFGRHSFVSSTSRISPSPYIPSVRKA